MTRSNPAQTRSHRLAVAGAALALGLGSLLAGATAAQAWSSGIGAAPWMCEDTHFSGSSWHPISTESRSSTYGAGTCFNAYPLSAQLRYVTSGYTIAKKCTSGGGGGSGNCQIISVAASGSYTNYKGGRHGLGTTFFLT